MKNTTLFETALRTLCFSWGGDAPADAIWAYNDFVLWIEAEYNVKFDELLEEDLSNYESLTHRMLTTIREENESN